jgi:hypothetical protein
MQALKKAEVDARGGKIQKTTTGSTSFFYIYGRGAA